jgi:hypothetical protein
MAMSPRLLRPRAGGVHPEALDWRSRVIANGGTASASTLKAVDTFCKAISSAGIRNRFLRLNLFAGDNLSACLVPLYRSSSLGGATVGNSTDTNNGPFVSGDYIETGTTGGLYKSGAKWLTTGVKGNDLPAGADGHLSASSSSGRTFSFSSFAIATRQGAGANNSSIYIQSNYCETTIADGLQSRAATSTATGAHLGRLLASRTSTTSLVQYKNGSSVVSNTTTSTAFTATSAGDISVFTIDNLTPNAAQFLLLHSYSIGLGMTGSQASAFDSALSTFLSALGRA